MFSHKYHLSTIYVFEKRKKVLKKIIQPKKKSAPSKKSTRAKRNTCQKTKKHNRYSEPYGVSKLERDFALNFLDKLNIDYVYEYEAKDIGRFYDFAVISPMKGVKLIMEEENGVVSVSQERNDYRVLFLIEVDGSYFHSDPRVVDKENMNRMQKRNARVDEIKDKWCALNHIPLLRIYEYDIRNNPKMVERELRDVLEYIGIQEKKKTKHGKFSKQIENETGKIV